MKQSNLRQTTKKTTKNTTKTTIKTTQQAAPEPADDDPVPDNIDEFRNALARRISRFIGDRQKYWRGCKEPACRRWRACAAPRIHCSNAPPLAPMTPDQKARAIARVHRALREAMARQDRGT